jgi:hypothetical protein
MTSEPDANDSEEIKKEVALASQRKITERRFGRELASAVGRGGVNSVGEGRTLGSLV